LLVILNGVKNLVLLLKGPHPRFFGHESCLRMTGPVVVLSIEKDLVLIVILNRVKNLVLLLKGPHPRFFRPEAFRMTPSTHPRSFVDCGSSG